MAHTNAPAAPAAPAARDAGAPDLSRRPRRLQRGDFVLAALVALGVFVARYALARSQGRDFMPLDLGASLTLVRSLLTGYDIYSTSPDNPVFAAGGVPLYPLPGLLPLAPLAGLSDQLAVSVFNGLSFGALTLATARHGRYRLLGLLGWPAVYSLLISQWSVLLAACWLLPALASLTVIKPQIALAWALSRWDGRWWRWAIGGGLALTAIAFALDPDWLLGWIDAFGLGASAMPRVPGAPVPQDAPSSLYVVPIAHPLGLLLPLALLRWRRPESRLLHALACVPHNPRGYEYAIQMVVVPSSARQALTLAVLSWCSFIAYLRLGLGHTQLYSMQVARTGALLAVFYPALLLVLRRPNVGTVPRWIETGVARLRLPLV